MRLPLCTALLSCSILAAAEPVPLTNHVLRALPAPGSVAIDGEAADWDLSGAIAMTDDRAQPRHLVRVAAMHDAAGMYLLFQFRDRTPLQNRIDPVKAPGRAWCGDCVQLRIDTGNPAGRPEPLPLQILHLDAYWWQDGGRATAHAVYADMSPGGRTERVVAEAEGAGVQSGYRRDPDGQGYTQELRLDWKLLRPDGGQPFLPGSSLRLAIEAMWGDHRFQDHPATRVTDLLNPKRPETDQIWANPGAWGTVEFLAQGQVEPAATARLWPELLARNAALVEPPPDPADSATVAPDQPCLKERSAVERQLNAWYAAKTAAGNRGDVYDNRDREHSHIERRDFPQLTSWQYTPDQRKAGLDYALFTGVLAPVAIGNSSTAAHPERGGCNPRFAMMVPAGLMGLYAQYRGNNLYAYPAHHDYHPGRSGRGFHGDLLPLNQPYCLISRGSSGSDIPFLNATIHAAAAFNPVVKRVLVRQGLLMPTIQALLRATYRGGADGYFSGQAHPAVFEGTLLDEEKLVEAAHALTLDGIPPLAQVLAEAVEPLRPGVNAPATSAAERLAVSPCATGFVFRRWGRTLRLAADAGTSYDPAGRPLTFRWALLQGDPAKVHIDAFDGGRRARIAVDWHARFPVQPGSPIATNRIDIGLFASADGRTWSAPAFISVVCPDNELRTYAADGRLVDLHYAAIDTAIGYSSTCIMPAEGVAPYDVRRWPELLARAAAGEGDLFARLCAQALTAPERAALAAAAARLAETAAQIAREGEQEDAPRNRHQRVTRLRRDAERLSQVLLAADPALGAPVKERIEGLLNAWQEDPAWYLDHRAEVDQALARLPAEARQPVEAARQRLLALGIYRQEGDAWTLHARLAGPGPAATRLTAAERMELRRLHLLLQTRVLLPEVLVRPEQFHYVDYRIRQPTSQWLCFDPGAAAPLVRADVPIPKPKELEDP